MWHHYLHSVDHNSECQGNWTLILQWLIVLHSLFAHSFSAPSGHLQPSSWYHHPAGTCSYYTAEAANVAKKKVQPHWPPLMLCSLCSTQSSILKGWYMLLLFSTLYYMQHGSSYSILAMNQHAGAQFALIYHSTSAFDIFNFHLGIIPLLVLVSFLDLPFIYILSLHIQVYFS